MIHALLEATHDLLFRIRKALSEEKKKKKIFMQLILYFARVFHLFIKHLSVTFFSDTMHVPGTHAHMY